MQGEINIPINATWEEYLEMEFPEDKVTESLLDPLSLGSGNPFSTKPVPQVTPHPRMSVRSPYPCASPLVNPLTAHAVLCIPWCTPAKRLSPFTFFGSVSADDSLRKRSVLREELGKRGACDSLLHQELISCTQSTCMPHVFSIDSLVPLIFALSPLPCSIFGFLPLPRLLKLCVVIDLRYWSCSARGVSAHNAGFEEGARGCTGGAQQEGEAPDGALLDGGGLPHEPAPVAACP